jgi:hypothetical protein
MHRLSQPAVPLILNKIKERMIVRSKKLLKEMF